MAFAGRRLCGHHSGVRPVHLLEAYRAAMDSVFGEGSCYVLNVRNYGALCVTEAL